MEKIFRQNPSLVILLILAFGFWVRIYVIDLVPPSLHVDEVDVGYQAYSLLKTGRDYFGNFLPLHIHSFTDWCTPLYFYLTIPFVAILGLNPWAVRLVSVFAGTLSIFLVYLTVKKIWPERVVALLSALLFAIAPWHLVLSRTAFWTPLLLTLFFAGLYFFLAGLEKPIMLFLAALFFGLTLFTYSTAKFFIPFFLLGIFYIFRKRLIKFRGKILIGSLAIFFVFGAVMAKEILLGYGGERFKIISIFTDTNSISPALHARFLSTWASPDFFLFSLHPGTLAPVFYNQATTLVKNFFGNYLAAFSPEYLFIRGDINSRHSVPGFGVFYWLEAITIPLGFLFFHSRRLSEETKKMVFFWLFLSPVPAALTRDGAGHTQRLFFFLPVMEIFSAIGIWSVCLKLIKKPTGKIMLAIFFSFFTYNVLSFAYSYRFIYPVQTAREWHDGYRQLFAALNKIESRLDKIIIGVNTEPVMPFLGFYGKVNPQEFQKREMTEEVLAEEIKVKHLLGTKYYFGELPVLSAPNNLLGAFDQKTVYITRGEANLPQLLANSFQVEEIISYPTGDPAFFIISRR